MIFGSTEIDYGTLEKGDVLSVQHCESVIGVSRELNPQAYSLSLMGLVEQVERDLHAEYKRYTVATRKGQIVVLTDAEASEYNDHGFESGLKKSRRAHFRMQQVDVTNLDKGQKAGHDANLVKQAVVLSAARDARKKLTPAAAKRSTPKLD